MSIDFKEPTVEDGAVMYLEDLIRDIRAGEAPSYILIKTTRGKKGFYTEANIFNMTVHQVYLSIQSFLSRLEKLV